LLLRAALCGGEESVAAWRRLRQALDLDMLEPESTVLLPLVHRQLATADPEDPLLPRLQGMRRRTWYVNQLRLDRLVPALQGVQESGADPLVVGTFELPAHYYEDLGVRAVTALHLLVRPDHFERATRCLAEAGWTSERRSRFWTCFKSAEDEECVVHRRLFDEFRGAEEGGPQPEELWEGTIGLDLNGVAARALAPVDELLDVCLRGARMGRWRSHVWLADAHTILRVAGAGLDWAGLVERARRLRASLGLRDALRFLRAKLDAPVPEGVIEELGRVPVRRRELLAHRAAGARWPLLGASPLSLTRFLRVTADRNVLGALAWLPSFLRDEWGLERRAQVPSEAARKSLARIGAGTPRWLRRS
jgi:Uncharacterised nucleotidyltransferase